MTKPELTIGEVSRVARKMMKTYYHFTGDTLRDGRPIPKPGVWLKHDGPVIPCKSGLHASEHPFDALEPAHELLCDVVPDAVNVVNHSLMPPRIGFAERLIAFVLFAVLL